MLQSCISPSVFVLLSLSTGTSGGGWWGRVTEHSYGAALVGESRFAHG